LARESLRRELETRRSVVSMQNLDTKLLSNQLSVRNLSSEFYDPTQMSPMNKTRMVVNLRDSIWDNKVLEDKRIDLSLRYDFSLTEVFSMFDYSKTGYVSLLD